MAGLANPQTPLPPCRRCHTTPSIITVRTEPLCQPCFVKYIQTKTVKRLETFRVRHASPDNEKTLLLALSFGPCSTTLLHILDLHLKGQESKTGRRGFSLLVVHVLGFPDGDDEDDAGAEERLERVKRAYPDHEYATTSLSSILDHQPALQVAIHPASSDWNIPAPSRLTQLLATLPSASSRTALLQTLFHRLLLHHANAKTCSALLHGSSTTLLAEQTMALTAAGRGSVLPTLISDPAPNAFPSQIPTTLPVYHPLRDLLRKELTAYTTLHTPSLTPLLAPQPATPQLPVSSRNATIDSLMCAYFASVERDYPSIVANVVRTVGKLEVPSHGMMGRASCEVCDAGFAQTGDLARSRLCYGCIRMLGRGGEVVG